MRLSVLARAVATLATIVASALALLFPVTVGAGGPTLLIKNAKHRHGPYFHDVVEVDVSDPKDLWTKAISTTDHVQTIALEDLSSGPGLADFRVSWYRKARNITEAVEDGTYEYKLQPDTHKLFRIHLRPRVVDPGGFCLAAEHTAIDPDTGRDSTLFAVNGVGCG